ncbi:hypothetical protein [Helicobacter saguini]|uniref:hypothetical protein n=1 Tax=Helicobacter saguini TaxID=1548018 RepID=UPI001928F779|nr:hypothetical protein [Helicobacter saguini]
MGFKREQIIEQLKRKNVILEQDFIYTINALIIEINKKTGELEFLNTSKKNIGKYTK